MRRLNKRLLTAIAVFFNVQMAIAANTAFTYQGQLKQDGVPANGDFDFRFTLFSTVLPGVFGGPACLQRVHVAEGLFTAKIDFGSDPFGGLPMEMQIDVKPFTQSEILDCVSHTIPDPFTSLTPRQPLTPAPYAIHALSAPNPSALDAGDGNPTNALSVDAAGNVGIGTQNPAAPLHVVEGSSGAAVNANASLALERNGNNYLELLAPEANEAGILFGKPSQGSAAGGIIYDNSATPDGLQFRTNNNVTRMIIDSAGDVGIGTTPESGKNLHVKGDSRFDGPNGVSVRNPNNSSGVLLLSWLNDVPRIRWGGNGAGSTNGFDFQRGGDVSVLRILNDGSVGIGTTAPTSKLHVIGDIKATGDVTTSGDFLYAASRTRYFSIPVRAFQSNNKDMPWKILPTGAGEYVTSSSFPAGVSVELAAPVHLPDGAVVTELRVAVIDDTPDFNISVSLKRAAISNSPPSNMASVTSSGTPNETNLVDSSISNATIDNSQFCYWVQANWNNSADLDIDLGPVRIAYTVSGP
jgi:hypothetical protein